MRTRQPSLRVLVMAGLLVAALWSAGAPTTAQVVVETDDAGDLPSTALDLCNQSVQSIYGEIEVFSDAEPGTTPFCYDWFNQRNHDVDMFCITITDPASFSASTINLETAFTRLDPWCGENPFNDTALYLFDAAGLPVYWRDRVPCWESPLPSCPVVRGEHRASLPAGHALGPTEPGNYFLAVTGGTRRALPSFGHISYGPELFDRQLSGFQPGPPQYADFPVAKWGTIANARFSFGPYRIDLTGVGPSNQPPEAQDDLYDTYEDTPLSVDAPGVLGNDTDADGDVVSANQLSDPSSGMLTLNPDGSFFYVPETDFHGEDSFTYEACDPAGDCDGATVRITVEPVNAPPIISEILHPSARWQYSDLIEPLRIVAEDADSAELEIGSLNLPQGLWIEPEDDCSPVGPDGALCAWVVGGPMLGPSGIVSPTETITVTFTVSDTERLWASAVISHTVVPEDVVVVFDRDNPVAVPVLDAIGVSGAYTVTHVVGELDEALGVPGDRYLAGDIRKAAATLMLEPVGPGASVQGACGPPEIIDGVADPDSEYDYDLSRVSCRFAEVPVNTYTIMARVGGGYYLGSAEDVLTVYDPSLGFTTGGGRFYWPGTARPELGYPGDRTNFGYTMKYGRRGDRVKGSLLLIRHTADGSIYRVKSNALHGLALGAGSGFGWASFSGKATYLEPGWPNPIGNHEFVAYVEDWGEPGRGADRFWIEIYDHDDVLVPALSMDRPAHVNAEIIEGGNIVVPH